MAEEVSRFKIEAGGIIRHAWWSAPARRCWIARVRKNRAAPGGMGREFFARADARGRFYVLPNLQPGDGLEFAVDLPLVPLVGGHDRRMRLRRYFVVRSITESELVLEMATASQAASGGLQPPAAADVEAYVRALEAFPTEALVLALRQRDVYVRWPEDEEGGADNAAA